MSTASRIADDVGAAFRVRAFVAVVGMLTALIAALQLFPLRKDVFAIDDPDRLAILNELPAPDVAELKLGHAMAVPRYDVGLFGSSRVLNVSAADVGLPRARFFNFALPGQSVRMTVSVLEALARRGKAPRVAVISLDNLELQYFANPPLFWGRPLNDLGLALSAPDMVLRDRLIIVERYAMNAWDFLTELWSAVRLERRFQLALSWPAAGHSDKTAYRDDGSHAEKPASGEPIPPLRRQSRQVVPALFHDDLVRLARLQRSGTRVIIYESPLEPNAARFVTSRPAPYAVRQREQLFADCRELGLECHGAPRLRADALWSDASHPPAAQLGRYIAFYLGVSGRYVSAP